MAGNKILRDEKGRFIKGTSNWNEGLTKETDERVRDIAKNKTGKNHYNWKGGKTLHPAGTLYQSKDGGRYIESHYVWCINNEMYCIPHGFEVHHIDCDPTNNDPKNLALLPKDYHRKLHYHLQLKDNPDRIYFGKNQHMRGEV